MEIILHPAIFHGTPPFSHPKMFLVKRNKDDKWSAPRIHAGFYQFSLAMTLACIVQKGVLWSGFNKKVATAFMLNDRHQKTEDLIKGSGLDRKSKAKVLGWIDSGQKRSGALQRSARNMKARKI